jgi:RNA polymerase sigma factor (sigma-70 family)
MRTVVRQAWSAALQADTDGPTDGQLLECFLNRQEEPAFEALVRRHGPMVLGVCNRILRNHHDAEDAFQATFLVLVRKADSVVPREMVANWLYGVAYMTAIKARARTGKVRARERQVAQMPEPEMMTPVPEHWEDWRELLDQELSRLPDKYRVPIVLCDLENRSRKEAARQLGWAEGTLSGRLSRARRMLAERLRKRGMNLSAGLLALMLAQQATALVPEAIVNATVQAGSLFAAGQTAASVASATVAALTEGVLRAMLLTKVKTCATILLALGLLVSGAGVTLSPSAAAEPVQIGQQGDQGEKQNGQQGDQGEKQNGQQGEQGEKQNGQAGQQGENQNGQQGEQGDKQNGQQGDQGDNQNGQNGGQGARQNGQNGNQPNQANGNQGNQGRGNQANGNQGNQGNQIKGNQANGNQANGNQGNGNQGNQIKGNPGNGNQPNQANMNQGNGQQNGQNGNKNAPNGNQNVQKGNGQNGNDQNK